MPISQRDPEENTSSVHFPIETVTGSSFQAARVGPSLGHSAKFWARSAERRSTSHLPEACTSQIDVAYLKSPRQEVVSESGLHLAHNAEVIMRPGAADRVRQAGQVCGFDSGWPVRSINGFNTTKSQKSVLHMSQTEWCAIFRPQFMRGNSFRRWNVKVVEQEAEVWAITS